MGTTATASGRSTHGTDTSYTPQDAWQGWAPPRTPGAYVTAPLLPRCPASAGDLIPLFEAAGLAIVVLDGAGRLTVATPTVERLLAADPERATVWRAASALVATLRRPAARAAASAPTHAECTTALGTYRLAALASPGAEGGWAAVTLQRVGADTSADAWLGATHGLSPREQQVARLLAEGHTTAETAAALGISAHTARHHAERVYEKLGVRSRAALGRVLGSGARAVSLAS